MEREQVSEVPVCVMYPSEGMELIGSPPSLSKNTDSPG